MVGAVGGDNGDMQHGDDEEECPEEQGRPKKHREEHRPVVVAGNSRETPLQSSFGPLPPALPLSNFHST
jgi:hypothetical protein